MEHAGVDRHAYRKDLKDLPPRPESFQSKSIATPRNTRPSPYYSLSPPLSSSTHNPAPLYQTLTPSPLATTGSCLSHAPPKSLRPPSVAADRHRSPRPPTTVADDLKTRPKLHAVPADHQPSPPITSSKHPCAQPARILTTPHPNPPTTLTLPPNTSTPHPHPQPTRISASHQPHLPPTLPTLAHSHCPLPAASTDPPPPQTNAVHYPQKTTTHHPRQTNAVYNPQQTPTHHPHPPFSLTTPTQHRRLSTAADHCRPTPPHTIAHHHLSLRLSTADTKHCRCETLPPTTARIQNQQSPPALTTSPEAHRNHLSIPRPITPVNPDVALHQGHPLETLTYADLKNGWRREFR